MQTIIAWYNTRQRGVAILFNNDNEYVTDNEHTFIDPNGNYIIARLMINKQTDLTIVNIYCPNKHFIIYHNYILTCLVKLILNRKM